MRLDRGIAKKLLLWGASFDLQVLQIPTYARVRGIGLEIDRCITQFHGVESRVIIG